MSETTKPTINVLCKLGSLAIHVEEAMSNKGHKLDIGAIKGILEDPEIKEWLKQMDKLALLPKKRITQNYLIPKRER